MYKAENLYEIWTSGWPKKQYMTTPCGWFDS